MRIAVLGGGRVGGALAATWREHGHDVVVSQRDTVAATAAHGEVVLLAVPAGAAAGVLAEAGSALDGTVVIDATNNLGGGPNGAAIAGIVPSARVVKAFNTVFSTYFHDTPPARPASLVYCGDDDEAKASTARLIADAGFEPVDAGGSDRTPLLEALARLVIGIAYEQGRGPFVYRFEAS